MTEFESHFIDVYGDEGKQWLDRLPEQINAMTERYQLSQLERADYMNYNYLMTGYQDDTPIMLKLSMFTHLINNEITCLTAYQDRGAIKLLAHEPGMILMERAQPGTMLKDHYSLGDRFLPLQPHSCFFSLAGYSAYTTFPKNSPDD